MPSPAVAVAAAAAATATHLAGVGPTMSSWYAAPFASARPRARCRSRKLLYAQHGTGPSRHHGSHSGVGPVLVLGGGIIGVSVAYHLALRGVKATVVDHAGIASCASGKAGGFLARDWNDRGPLGSLARASFDMHEKLAERLQLKSYRRLSCKSVAISGALTKPQVRKLEGVEWVDAGSEVQRLMGDERTIAQVHPKELTEAMWSEAQHLVGAELLRGTVNEVIVEGCGETATSASSRVSGCLVDGTPVLADTVVLCMGPWSQVLSLLEPQIQIYGQKCHSVLLQSQRVFSEAVFFKGLGDPEVYPRNNGENYVTGFPDPAVVVTEPPGNVQVRDDVCERLEHTVRQVSSEMRQAEVTARQSCFLPLTADSFPAMGRLPSPEGAYVCAGHGCWGILNAPASGLAMAELILDGKASTVDIRPFHPRRLLGAESPSWAPSGS